MIDVVGILEIPSVTFNNDARFPAWQNFYFIARNVFEWLFRLARTFANPIMQIERLSGGFWGYIEWLLGESVCWHYELFLIMFGKFYRLWSSLSSV